MARTLSTSVRNWLESQQPAPRGHPLPTPIRRQYLELKQRYPGTILFFRLGDFYETFDDDAVTVADALQITLTSKPMGGGERVPLAGVPYHSIDGHVAKLVALGHRVAICEQMADPATVKGIVPRDVVRVVTAGTVTSEASLEADQVRELAAVAVRGGRKAAAFCDVSTGSIRIAIGAAVAAEFARQQPAELLIESPDDLDAPAGTVSLTRLPLSETAVAAELGRQFSMEAIGHLAGEAAEQAALAHVLAYLRETYPGALGSIQRIRPVDDGNLLHVDQKTLRNLDVFPAYGGRSLYGVLNRAKTSMGSRRLRDWLTRPLRDVRAIDERLDAVEWSIENAIAAEQIAAVLRGSGDIERLAGSIGRRSARPRELHTLRESLRAAIEIGTMLERNESLPALLAGARASLAAAAGPLAALDAALDPDPPVSFDEGGVIAPGFNPEVDSLRELTRDARGYLLGIERLERERTGIKSLKVGHNKVFGYYIEVSAANASHVPEHYQRRQTLVGAERYVTDELKEHESRLVGARDRLVELERQAYDALVETLACQLDALQSAGAAVALIDLLIALATVAGEAGYVRPRFNEGRQLLLRDARHPVVEAALGPGLFVPNDCELAEDCQVLILTGPNMSGKSTYLRQVALIALMAQAGSFVPAAEAELPLFDRIFTRIGAQDDLAAGQSTFMVEMVETAQILHQATPRSLVVLDEVGRGTSTFDGMAIARATIEFLHNRKEVAARTLFATHYHELTDLADVLPRVQNAHVAVHEEGGEVVFEHRMVPGPSDRSYGIHVGRLAGLPPAVVQRAEHLLAELEGSRERLPASADPRSQASFLPEPSKVEESLRGLDVDALSPLEAIQKLYELRALAGTEGS